MTNPLDAPACGRARSSSGGQPSKKVPKEAAPMTKIRPPNPRATVWFWL